MDHLLRFADVGPSEAGLLAAEDGVFLQGKISLQTISCQFDLFGSIQVEQVGKMLAT
jgi:hypothetical protein